MLLLINTTHSHSLWSAVVCKHTHTHTRHVDIKTKKTKTSKGGSNTHIYLQNTKNFCDAAASAYPKRTQNRKKEPNKWEEEDYERGHLNMTKTNGAYIERKKREKEGRERRLCENKTKQKTTSYIYRTVGGKWEGGRQLPPPTIPSTK